MSPSGKSVKRQRANDVTQDVKASPNARTKRLKTDQDIQKTPKGDVVVATSNVEKNAEKKDPRWSLDLMFRGEIYDIDPIISTDEKYVRIQLTYMLGILILCILDIFSLVAETPSRYSQCRHIDQSELL